MAKTVSAFTQRLRPFPASSTCPLKLTGRTYSGRPFSHTFPYRSHSSGSSTWGQRSKRKKSRLGVLCNYVEAGQCFESFLKGSSRTIYFIVYPKLVMQQTSVKKSLHLNPVLIMMYYSARLDICDRIVKCMVSKILPEPLLEWKESLTCFPLWMVCSKIP